MIALSPTARRPGRFQGFERVDIIRWLHAMGLGHVLRRVFEHLSAVDIANAARVCVRWHVAVVQDALAERKIKSLISNRKQNLENLYPSLSLVARLSPRKAMSNVTNLSTSSSSSSPSGAVLTPVSPVSRHQLFTEEAAKLSPGEHLASCPRCTSPSRVSPSTRAAGGRSAVGRPAACTRSACAFAFCAQCLCASHGDTPCRTSKATPTGRVGSKRSRKRLRRL